MAYSMPARRSAADVIYAQLREEIMSLNILPGAKVSEAEVAAKFGVSRQPVREALNLLSSEGLVAIQPQKATRVGRFSLKRIEVARYMRRALDIEVVKGACDHWSDAYRAGFERNLEAQDRAVTAWDTRVFHRLDLEFHALLTEAAQVPFVFERIKTLKAHIDRICVLSLHSANEMAILVQDHRDIFDAISRKDAHAAEQGVRRHLSRIERTLDTIRQANASYFEP